MSVGREDSSRTSLPPQQVEWTGKLSVIIPAWNEAAEMPRVLEVARGGCPHEVIVADGGSTDGTAALARSMGALVIEAPRCRAVQLNRGAEAASGDLLLFLHADTILPPCYVAEAGSLLEHKGVAGGAFTFAISDAFFGRWLVERTTNWRARRWQFPYGDQALFVRRATFERLGGFAEMPIMEDYEFVRRLRRLGRIEVAAGVARTSGRRWRRLGWVRTTLVNQFIVLGYHSGVSPQRLAAWYRRP